MAEQKISTEGGSSDPSAGLYDQIDDLLAEIDQACEEFEGSYDESAPPLLPDLNTLTPGSLDESAASPDAAATDDDAGANQDDLNLLDAINAELSSQQPAAQGQVAASPPVSVAQKDPVAQNLAPASGDDLDELVAELASAESKPQSKPDQRPQTATTPPTPPQASTQPTAAQPQPAAPSASSSPEHPLETDPSGSETSSASTATNATARTPGPSLAARLQPIACSAGAILLSPLAKLLHDQPRVVRDTIGWIGLATIFYAICLWSYALIFRSVSKPPEAVQGISIIGEPPAELRR